MQSGLQCIVSFPYKYPSLGRYLVGKDIPLLTTLEELKEKILHYFVWVPLEEIAFRIFFYPVSTYGGWVMMA